MQELARYGIIDLEQYAQEKEREKKIIDNLCQKYPRYFWQKVFIQYEKEVKANSLKLIEKTKREINAQRGLRVKYSERKKLEDKIRFLEFQTGKIVKDPSQWLTMEMVQSLKRIKSAKLFVYLNHQQMI